MIAYKFLAKGAVAPFTGFHWPGPDTWVSAPAELPDRWIHACRPGDVPYWLDEELWRIELAGSVREARCQVTSPRARLVGTVASWNAALGREYAKACVLRARDLALPHLAPALQGALGKLGDLEAIMAAVDGAGPPALAAAYLSDAAKTALHASPAAASYIACMLASRLNAGTGAFEAERAWQARWLAGRLGLDDGH